MTMELQRLIEELIRRGSSLDMNWGEDTAFWEVSFITGGVRHVACRSDLLEALQEAKNKALVAACDKSERDNKPLTGE